MRLKGVGFPEAIAVAELAGIAAASWDARPPARSRNGPGAPVRRLRQGP